MREVYEELEAEVICFESVDIITKSSDTEMVEY